jgi:hypothetical protein
MSDTTTTKKIRTITLTDRSPVKIVEDDWPVIAHGSYSEHDNQYEFQSNRKWKANVRVRQHADGRAIVYGTYEYTTAFQGERDVSAKAGVLLDASADKVAAIRAVGQTLAESVGERDFSPHIAGCVGECIADLPAEDLT